MKILGAAAVAVLCVLLSGCGEDKGAILADCQLAHPNNGYDVSLCMRSHGYAVNPDTCYAAGGPNYLNAACYYATNLNGMIGEATRGQ